MKPLKLVRKTDGRTLIERKIEALFEEIKVIENPSRHVPSGASEEKLEAYDRAFTKNQQELEAGKLDDLIIEIGS